MGTATKPATPAGGRSAENRSAAGRSAENRSAASRSAERRPPADEDGDVNLALVTGTCSGPADVRVLASGTRVAALSVRSPAPDRRFTSVPVTVWDPPAWVETLEAGERVVVVGALRRRFYRSGAGVSSRVDLEATGLARARDGRRVRTLLARAAALIDGAR